VGNQVLVGADGDGSRGPESGAAYLFYFDGVKWRQHQKITSPTAEYKQHFGRYVTMSEDSILVGATGEHHGAGAVYRFKPRKSDPPK